MRIISVQYRECLAKLQFGIKNRYQKKKFLKIISIDSGQFAEVSRDLEFENLLIFWQSSSLSSDFASKLEDRFSIGMFPKNGWLATLILLIQRVRSARILNRIIFI